MTLVAEPVDARPSLTVQSISAARKFRNLRATVLMWLAVLIAMIPLGFLIYYVVREGLKIMSWAFLTKNIPISVRTEGPGMAPAIVGTLLITGVATLIAVPLGILGAVYIVEYGADNRLARLIRFMGDVMAGVPSIVMGLFIYTIWVVRFHHFTGFAGSLALACLMLPIVIRASEGMLRLVPRDLREASYALGASKWRTVLSVVLPTAVGGIMTGTTLAVARAGGETAPLLFVCAATTQTVVWSPNGAVSSLPFTIFSDYDQAGGAAQAWGAAFTLIVLVLVSSLTSRYFLDRSKRKLGQVS